MSTPATAELHPCKCGCDEMVRGTWARGHWARANKAARLTPLPGPDVPDEDLDMGLLEPDFDIGMMSKDTPESRDAARQRAESARPTTDSDDEEIPQDRPPGHLSAPPGRDRGSGRRAGPARVTAATRKDITAKIKMPLFLGGKIWEARDPWCGTVFIAQVDPIADALTDIVCDSADLVAFFTGPAGGFMKYLNLASALAPVAQVAWAHHVTHAIGGEGERAGQPDMRAYAA